MFDVHKFFLLISPVAFQAGGPPEAEHLNPSIPYNKLSGKMP